MSTFFSSALSLGYRGVRFGAVPFSFVNAALVGAKTVYGPLAERVPTRPAFFTSVTRVENRWSLAATATIVFGAAARSAGAAGRARGEQSCAEHGGEQ